MIEDATHDLDARTDFCATSIELLQPKTLSLFSEQIFFTASSETSNT